MILNINKALIVIASIFYIQNIYAQYNLPPVEDDKFFDALIQELDFLEADWMDNHSITRDIILGASWVNQDEQENYLGEIIFSDKKLNKKLKNKGNVKDDIAVLLVVVTNNSKLGSPSKTSAGNGVLSRIAQITSKSFKRSINVAGSLK